MKEHKQLYLDNLKVFLIALFVMHHCFLSYTTGASWLIINPERASYFIPLLAINSTFVMGLLFFIGGYFTQKVYRQKGLSQFVIYKFKRLIIPAIFVIIFILPLGYYLALRSYPGSIVDFYRYYFFTPAHFTFGYTWFLIQLFVYSVVYAVFCQFIFQYTKNIKFEYQFVPNHFAILLFALFLFVTTYGISQISSIRQWYGFHSIEVFHLPQYIGLFYLGTMASQRSWLKNIPTSTGLFWLLIAAVLILAYCFSFSYDYYFSKNEQLLWDQFLTVSLSVGLLILFREYAACTNRLLDCLAKNAYGVFLFHFPIAIMMNKLLLLVSTSPLLLFLVTFVGTYVLTNLLCVLLRKTGLLRLIYVDPPEFG